MKKAITITALVAIIGFTGVYQASAYMGHGGCNGSEMGMRGNAELDDATKAKLEAFFVDTQGLRKNMAMKRAEKRALMNNDEPDAKKVGELTGELFDLRSTMHAKAQAAGLGDVIGKGRGCGKKCDGAGNSSRGCNGNGKGKRNGKQ